MARRSRPALLSGIAALALLANLFLPLIAIYGASKAQAAGGAMASLLGERILICTSGGFRWVSWDALQEPDDKDAPRSQVHLKCLVCYSSAHGGSGYLPPGTLNVPVVAQTLRFLRLPPRHDAYRSTKFPRYLSRAPPGLA